MTTHPAHKKNQVQQSTRILLLGIWKHLSLRRRIHLGLLLILMLLSGVAELVSLGSILPFLAVLSDPELLWGQPLARSIASYFGLTQSDQLLIPSSLAFGFAAVIAALVRLTNLRLNGFLAAAIGSDLSCEAYRRTLYQSYEVHVKRNSSAVISGATTKSERTVLALSAFLQTITSSVVAISLFIGLLFIDSAVAIGALVLFGGVYYFLAITVRKKFRRNSQQISKTSIIQIKALQEGLGAIRDVLLDNNQPTYVEIYRQTDWPQRQLQAVNKFLSAFPRYAVEALGLVAIAFLGGVMVLQNGTGGNVIPLLGAMALGAQRLLPALQQVYGGWSKIKSNNADMADVLAMLEQPLQIELLSQDPLILSEGIRLHGIHFRYGNDEIDILKGLDLYISRGERVGVIGSSGSGKSTMVDILMGLLTPTQGQIQIDGMNLHDPMQPERLVAWRAAVAHVPQTIYLADRSISENIAFGEVRSQIDFDRVQQAANQAQIANYIKSMPDGYQTIVGERGINLSGGQRQRIGIARALYKRAQILVLDEATAALDHSTEKAVMEAIEELSRSLTIITIAHRLSTLARCDRVIRISQGRITHQGPPELILN